jgi:2-polyprenyl-3-methyl-5-hydroxy-6-metoxy-1,4-benzoquinol methylase
MSRANELLRQIIYGNERSMQELLQEAEDYLKEVDNEAENAAALRGYAGGWKLEDAIKEHAFSLELAYYIWKIIPDWYSVYDFGAGPGFYSQFLKMRGVNVDAFDVSPNNELSLICICKFDLSEKININEQVDCVLCLEVGEHIEQEHESTVFDNICNHAKHKVILSWAIPGQGGFGHVNCQDNDHVIYQMAQRNFILVPSHTELLRQHCSGCTWFENTIMVFEKK